LLTAPRLAAIVSKVSKRVIILIVVSCRVRLVALVLLLRLLLSWLSFWLILEVTEVEAGVVSTLVALSRLLLLLLVISLLAAAEVIEVTASTYNCVGCTCVSCSGVSCKVAASSSTCVSGCTRSIIEALSKVIRICVGVCIASTEIIAQTKVIFSSFVIRLSIYLI